VRGGGGSEVKFERKRGERGGRGIWVRGRKRTRSKRRREWVIRLMRGRRIFRESKEESLDRRNMMRLRVCLT
jgi:hypothetical protein